MDKCIKKPSKRNNSELSNVQEFLTIKKYPYKKTLLTLLEKYFYNDAVKSFCSNIDEKTELYHQCKENLRYLLIPPLPPIIQSQLNELLNKVNPTVQNEVEKLEEVPKIANPKIKYKNNSHSTDSVSELMNIKGGKQSFTSFTIEKSPIENQHELRESGRFGSMPLYDDME